MNWGKGIILTYIVFIGIMVSMVVISMKQNVNLVSDDYYQREINYQQEIEMIENYNELLEKPVVTIDHKEQFIVIIFPKPIADNVKDGQIILFRPSDNRLDKVFKLDLSNSRQLLDASALQTGLWRAKLQWGDAERKYYHEFIVTL